VRATCVCVCVCVWGEREREREREREEERERACEHISCYMHWHVMYMCEHIIHFDTYGVNM